MLDRVVVLVLIPDKILLFLIGLCVIALIMNMMLLVRDRTLCVCVDSG